MSSQNQKVFVTRVKNLDNSIVFNYIKEEVGSYFVEIELEKVQNVADSTTLKRKYAFNLNEKSGTLFKLLPANEKKEIFCSYTFSFTKGTINPKVDYSINYLLPFQKNKSIRVLESKRFNVKPEVWKNYLVYSKTRDTIFAMRKGIVIDIRKFAITNVADANGQSLPDYRTEVIVEHADGTNASYSGLDEKSLFVSLNQTVYPHSRLGIMDDITTNGEYSFRFNVYYFTNEDSERLSSNNKIIQRSVMPFFLAQDGIQKLNNENNFIATYNDPAISQEMTEEEKEKYLSKNSIHF
ncbi:hypothetical protein ASD98_00945 [Flavobacterium sp. Root186]|nr:hypothetical protein ASD98_00945 [Flavobacterium sp. Root186]